MDLTWLDVCVCVGGGGGVNRDSAPHTHTSNQELHMRPHLPTFYHNDTLLYCILSF